MFFRTTLVLISFATLAACAKPQSRAELVGLVDTVQNASVGAAFVTINKERDLPNIAGGADIFGRKVSAGFSKLVFLGKAPDGGAIVERIEVDVHSTATTMSRTPGMFQSRSSASIVGNAYGVYGHGQSSASAITPIGETTTVLPPRASRFSVPVGKTLTLASGQTVEFIAVEPHQLTYRIRSGKPNP